jgi:pimeloyl-ACP methyl ester carboxylesterase/DNA-binding CsgD family transcriptional regulator
MAKTSYARTGDAHVAYQVTGEGPIDLVVVPGWVSHLEAEIENPLARAFWDNLASFSRLIRFDKRGTGLSDRNLQGGSLEDRVDEIRAVMDAAGSTRAALFGVSEGGAMAFAFAALHPERTLAIVLYASLAGPMRGSPEFPCGYESEPIAEFMQRAIRDHWGEGTTVHLLAPSTESVEAVQQAVARYERMAASPGAAAAKLQANIDGDVSHLIPAVRVPALVLHREGDRMVPLCHGSRLAHELADARFVVLPGDDHIPWVGDADRIIDEVREFLTGAPPPREADRVVVTALALRSPAGHSRLDVLDETIQRVVERSAGAAISRDLATFDGPARAIRAATAIVEAGAGYGAEIQAGLHAGECERRGGVVAGFPVEVARAVAALARPGEVLVSGTVKDLVAGSGLHFADRGSERFGTLGEWPVYAVASDAQAPLDPLAALTPSELRVAGLVAEGLGNVAIAEHLHMSRNTVESHLKHAYGKLGISSRVELATLVLSRGR